ncbi:DIS3-like exonuclease 2 [Sycon ciliatum]|uniref:DIS3-like exonuclease 2 n=1 Tax=Sycon ciliatum TaxID=27933 RepID=UPI0031F6CA4E
MLRLVVSRCLRRPLGKSTVVRCASGFTGIDLPLTPRAPDTRTSQQQASPSEHVQQLTQQPARQPRPNAQQGRKLELKLSESYTPHLTAGEVEEGLKDGSLFVGKFRINAKNYQHGFVPDPSGGPDIMFEGMYSRNRAFDGDEVVYSLQPRHRWKMQGHGVSGTVVDADLTSIRMQKTAEVKAIHKEVGSRFAACRVKLYELALGIVLFSPRDHRKPRIIVPLNKLPVDFRQKFSAYRKKLFSVEIAAWGEDAVFAQGQLSEIIGEAGSIEAEEAALLLEEGLDYPPFSEEIEAEVASMSAEITKEELKTRRDIRQATVFAIDPADSKDADDAIHWKPLRGKKYEVGVHIADVSYYVAPDGHIDRRASEQCFTHYLASRALHMLPPQLSEDLCSLRHAVDRRALSCIFTLNHKHEIVDTWIGPTAIHGKGKLSYDEADEILETGTVPDFAAVDGCQDDIVKSLKHLEIFTNKLKKGREEHGCVDIRAAGGKELKFIMGEDNEPISCYKKRNFRSGVLIEELMLLANQTVAKFLVAKQPDAAVFRTQTAPQPSKLNQFEEFCSEVDGVQIPSSWDHTSASAFLSSLKGMRIEPVICERLVRSMERADYQTFASGAKKDKEEQDVSHFALNMTHYTHFTSPIRRYPDLIAHRQVRDSLAGIEWSAAKDLVAQVEKSTAQEKRADTASQNSVSLFFGAYIRHVKEITTTAIVVEPLPRKLVVYLEQFGTSTDIFLDNTSLSADSFSRFQVLDVCLCHAPVDDDPLFYKVTVA